MCRDRTSQRVIGPSALYGNLLIDQPRTWQPAKTTDKRRTQLLLDVDVYRVTQPPKHGLVRGSLPRRHVHRLAGFIQVDAPASFKHGKINAPARVDMPH